MAVDTLGHRPAVHATPANAQERAWMFEPCEAVQTVTGHTVELAWADRVDTGEQPRRSTQADVLRGLRFLVFAILMPHKAIPPSTAIGTSRRA